MNRDADGRTDGRAVKVQQDLENQAVARFRRTPGK
jgi:hypothetical protein